MAFVFGPTWFYGLDSGFEIIAAVVLLFVAFYSFRVYRLTKLPRYLYFMLAFLSISGSYFLRAAADYIVYSSIIGQIPNVTNAIATVTPVHTFYGIGIIAFMILSFAGFMILVAIFMRMHSYRTVSLLFLLVVLIALLSTNKFLAFHFTLIIMLVFIIAHLFMNYRRRRKVSSFLVLYAMTSLLVAQVFFLMGSSMWYVVAHVVQLSGFLLLLLNMMLVFNK